MIGQNGIPFVQGFLLKDFAHVLQDFFTSLIIVLQGRIFGNIEGITQLLPEAVFDRTDG